MKINNAPPMNYYYDNKQTLSNEEIDKLVNIPTKQGFVNKVFGGEDKVT